MRFHATFTHTPENCRVHRPNDTAPDWAAIAKEVGVEIISAVVCQPVHTQFFVVETDEFSKLYGMFTPLQGYAKADITPVRDLINS